MKKYGTLILVAILAFVLWIWSKARAATRLDVKFGLPENITAQIDQAQIVWRQPITFTNLERTAINVQRMAFTVYAAGTPNVLGQAVSDQRFQILPGMTTTKVFVFVPITSIRPILALIGITLGGRRVGVDYKGSVTAEGATFPLEGRINVEIPTF